MNQKDSTNQAAQDDALLAALSGPAAPYTVEGTEFLPCGRPCRWGVMHKGQVIAEACASGAVGRIAMQQIAAAMNATTLAPQYGGPITDLAEGKVTLRAADGRDYRITAVFTDTAAANAYMAKNPGEALIGVQGDVALIAKVKPEVQS